MLHIQFKLLSQAGGGGEQPKISNIGKQLAKVVAGIERFLPFQNTLVSFRNHGPQPTQLDLRA